MPSAPDPAPCPRCQSANVDYLREQFPPLSRGPIIGYSVQCKICLCRTTPHHNRKNAKRNWEWEVADNGFGGTRGLRVFVPRCELHAVTG